MRFGIPKFIHTHMYNIVYVCMYINDLLKYTILMVDIFLYHLSEMTYVGNGRGGVGNQLATRPCKMRN